MPDPRPGDFLALIGDSTQQTFGPLVGIMPVASDEDAIRLMNDSPYGLSASFWSSDLERVRELCNQVATGTVS